MKKRTNINYNYAFLFYDIKEDRVNKVFKICKKYFYHHQKSVFRGEISTSKIIKLKAELKEVIDENEDFITIIKTLNEKSFGEDTLGTNPKDSEGLFV